MLEKGAGRKENKCDIIWGRKFRDTYIQSPTRQSAQVNIALGGGRGQLTGLRFLNTNLMPGFRASGFAEGC